MKQTRVQTLFSPGTEQHAAKMLKNTKHVHLTCLQSLLISNLLRTMQQPN